MTMQPAIPAKPLERQAEDIIDALAALHGIDVERLLHSTTDIEKRQRERAKLEERRRRLAKLYEMGDIEDAEYATRRDEIVPPLPV
jgi:aminoglycoside phosphotransferase (APT) family kinase protein